MLVRKVYKEGFLPVKEWDENGVPTKTYAEPVEKKVIVATKYKDAEVDDLSGTGKKLVLDENGFPVIEDGQHKYEDVEDKKIATREVDEACSWIEGWFDEDGEIEIESESEETTDGEDAGETVEP